MSNQYGNSKRSKSFLLYMYFVATSTTSVSCDIQEALVIHCTPISAHLNVGHSADRCDHRRLTVKLINVFVDRDRGAGDARGGGGGRRGRGLGQTESRPGEAGGGGPCPRRSIWATAAAAADADAGVDDFRRGPLHRRRRGVVLFRRHQRLVARVSTSAGSRSFD